MSMAFLHNLAFWMPERASKSAGDVDRLFAFILWLSIFFTLLIVGLLIIFVWRYRHRSREEVQQTTSHNNALELTWTIIPTILVLIIFYWGFRSYLRMAVPPPNAYEIQVSARMWNWSFTYPNGHVDNELHVPAHTPVQLVIASDDVIHSLYVPALRLKKDAVPGRYNKMWFEADQIGTFDIYCAAYCGTNHSQMLSKMVVHDADGFKRWLQEAGNWEKRMTPVEAGRMFYEKRAGCVQCHSLDGSSRVGPSFKDLFGHERRFADGSSVTADENYIRQSIYEPTKKIVAGYPPTMNSYKNSLKDKDVTAIIAFLKSLSDKGGTIEPTTRPSP